MNRRNLRILLLVLLGVLVFSLLYWTSREDYLLFHVITETFIIVIACGIFMIAWNSRRFTTSHYLAFLGIAYLFVGVLELLHMVAYKGMGVFMIPDPTWRPSCGSPLDMWRQCLF